MNLAIKPKTGDGIEASPAEWKFTAEVAKSFDVHVAKSVPFYQETQSLVLEVADWFVSDHSLVYDLGCATGTTMAGLLERYPEKDIRCIGVDDSEAMLAKAGDRLEGHAAQIELRHEDLLTYEFEQGASLFYCLYTLQFINPQKRLMLCQRIHQALLQRGALILVEKVLDHDPVVTDIFTHIHWSKKAEMGFDVTEIYAKAQSLRGVLVPFTVQENVKMLEAAGFSRVSVFFKWCNFCGIIAVK
jgi:tRNA (cmo5U34)-methyltransferase